MLWIGQYFSRIRYCPYVYADLHQLDSPRPPINQCVRRRNSCYPSDFPMVDLTSGGLPRPESHIGSCSHALYVAPLSLTKSHRLGSRIVPLTTSMFRDASTLIPLSDTQHYIWFPPTLLSTIVALFFSDSTLFLLIHSLLPPSFSIPLAFSFRLLLPQAFFEFSMAPE